ncbi:unnamed protein product [Urochloa humidicola]
MARLPKHAPAPAPLRGTEILPWVRSLCAQLSEGLALLPRPSAAWLPRSAPAWLRQLIKALFRLFGAGGPAQAAAAPPTTKKAPRRRGEAPAVPGIQGGDAGEGTCPAGSDSAPGGIDAALLGGAGSPTGKRAQRRCGKAPAGPGPQGGDVGEGAVGLGGSAAPTGKKAFRRPGKTPTGPDAGERPCPAVSDDTYGGKDATVLGGDGASSTKKARRVLGKTPTGLGPQRGDGGEGACSVASDFVPSGNNGAALGVAEAQKPEPGVAEVSRKLPQEDKAQKPEPGAKNSLFELGVLITTPDLGTKEPLQKQEEEQGSSHASLDDFTWEIVKSRKSCRGGPNLGAEVFCRKLPQETRCTYCKGKGHLAKDCPRTKASINLSTSCDSRGKGHCTKSKNVWQDGDEDKYNLKKQRFDEDEEEADKRTHRMYHEKLSSCKKDEILCLACYLEGKVVPIKKNYDVMKMHFKNKHSSLGTPCERKGCLARAKTMHDIGLHQDICHGI